MKDAGKMKKVTAGVQESQENGPELILWKEYVIIWKICSNSKIIIPNYLEIMFCPIEYKFNKGTF